jgi:hypothetical protein
MSIHRPILIIASSIIFSLLFVTPSSAQDKNKSKADPERAILEQLNPRPKRKPAPRGMRLLPGYKHKGAVDFEGNDSGEIWKEGGIRITYEMGFSEGQAVRPEDKDKFLQYSEKILNGRTVRCAFTKEKIYIVTVPLADDLNTLHAANFYTKVAQPGDAADMVSMALTLIQNGKQ